MPQWFEDDQLWLDLRDLLFPSETVANAVTEVDALSALLSLQPGSTILDLPCGIGRHSIELARRGHRVTGVDRTSIYIDQARAAGRAAGVAVDFEQGDMRDFCRAATFDVALNLWTSFGYFADAADDRRAIVNLFENLKPGGKLVIELFSKEMCARVFRERDWRTLADGRIFIEERRVRDGWEWIDNTWTILDGVRRREFSFGHRLYSGVELRQLAESVGFTDVRTYNGLSGKPFDHKAERLAIVATRPQA